MAKRGRPKKVDQGWGGEVSTVTEVGQTATASVQVIAPEPAPADPIVLPEGEAAVALLSALAIQNDRVTVARKRYEESAATTKARKGTLETESEALSRMLTEGTHAKPLPLFDADQSERDLKAMEDAIGKAAGVPQEAITPAEPTVESLDDPIVTHVASGEVGSEPQSADVF